MANDTLHVNPDYFSDITELFLSCGYKICIFNIAFNLSVKGLLIIKEKLFVLKAAISLENINSVLFFGCSDTIFIAPAIAFGPKVVVCGPLNISTCFISFNNDIGFNAIFLYNTATGSIVASRGQTEGRSVA